MKGEAVKGERKHNGVVARPSTCAISFIRTFNKATSYPITRSCENTFLCVDLPHFHPISIDIIGKNVKSALLRTFSKPNVIVGASNFALSRVEFEKESIGRGGPLIDRFLYFLVATRSIPRPSRERSSTFSHNSRLDLLSTWKEEVCSTRSASSTTISRGETKLVLFPISPVGASLTINRETRAAGKINFLEDVNFQNL